MPLYEYACDACGQHFELIRRFSDPEVDVCTHCSKGPVRRLVSSPAIQFKGSGWYITDYARKAKSETTKSEKGEKAADGTSDTSGSASGEKKSESAAKTDGGSTPTSAASSETKP